MVGITNSPSPHKESRSRVDYYWNPKAPRFKEHLVYGAGKPRCVLPLEALHKASDDGTIPSLRQQYTQAARDDPESLMNLALFLLIVDNDLSGGGDLLKDAAKRYPSAETLCQYARFLYNMKKEYTLAWQSFERALDADPIHVDTIGYYAGFVASVQRDYDKAERLFLRCLEIAPMHANHLGGYARFLATVRVRFTEAEACFERSIAADPNNVVNLNNYAAFLAEVQKDLDRAELYFRKAVDIDPCCGFAVRNLLNFLVWMRHDNDSAKRVWQQGGSEALRQSLDETYHPDKINPAVREDMAAEASFLERGKNLLRLKAMSSQLVMSSQLDDDCDLMATDDEEASAASQLCVTCRGAEGVCSISRLCSSTCEGPGCSCINLRWCGPCILQHYWHDTKGEIKSFGRCPTFRAEFCLEDLVVVTAADSDAVDSSESSNSDCELMQ